MSLRSIKLNNQACDLLVRSSCQNDNDDGEGRGLHRRHQQPAKQYAKAVSLLSEALRINEQDYRNTDKSPYDNVASLSSLHYCIHFSLCGDQDDDDDDNDAAPSDMNMHRRAIKKRRRGSTESLPCEFTFLEEEDLDGDDDNHNGVLHDGNSVPGAQVLDIEIPSIPSTTPVSSDDDNSTSTTSSVYFHRRPIKVPHCNQMPNRASLTLILLFNLALSCHLAAERRHHVVDVGGDDEKKNMARKQRLQYKKALQLYEVAYQFQRSHLQDGTSCLLLTMIMVNNLALCHQALGHSAQHQQCLEHLLSAVMFVTTTATAGYEYIFQDQEEQADRTQLLLQDFLRNVSQLVLGSNCCAQAA